MKIEIFEKTKNIMHENSYYEYVEIEGFNETRHILNVHHIKVNNHETRHILNVHHIKVNNHETGEFKDRFIVFKDKIIDEALKSEEEFKNALIKEINRLNTEINNYKKMSFISKLKFVFLSKQ